MFRMPPAETEKALLLMRLDSTKNKRRRNALTKYPG
jgi:hypothetical protein